MKKKELREEIGNLRVELSKVEITSAGKDRKILSLESMITPDNLCLLEEFRLYEANMDSGCDVRGQTLTVQYQSTYSEKTYTVVYRGIQAYPVDVIYLPKEPVQELPKVEPCSSPAQQEPEKLSTVEVSKIRAMIIASETIRESVAKMFTGCNSGKVILDFTTEKYYIQKVTVEENPENGSKYYDVKYKSESCEVIALQYAIGEDIPTLVTKQNVE